MTLGALHAGRATSGSPRIAAVDSAASDPEGAGEESSEAEDEILELPPLPEGVDPLHEIKAVDLKKIVADAEAATPGRKLGRVERMELIHELTCARARIQILDSEIRMAYVRGMDELRERGEFVEFARGQPCEGIRGVISVGEGTPDGGSRLFRLYPDQFPEVYDKRQEKLQIAEQALRRIYAVAQ